MSFVDEEEGIDLIIYNTFFEKFYFSNILMPSFWSHSLQTKKQIEHLCYLNANVIFMCFFKGFYDYQNTVCKLMTIKTYGL